MKKTTWLAILILLTGCYTPMNNSGTATTKPWLEISGKKVNFDGKQYDSCYQFNVHFWPQEAAQVLDLKESCISGCCWRSDKETVVLDFNKHFESDLAIYGKARKYSPEKITLKIAHSNLLNTTKVTVSPQGAISNTGLIKLSYKEYENPTRLAQLEVSARQQAALEAAQRTTYYQSQEQRLQPGIGLSKKSKGKKKKINKSISQEEVAKNLFQRRAGTKVDHFFYQMDRTYKKQGAVFLLSDRIIQVRPTLQEGVYNLSCQAKARTGLDIEQLRASTFSCGTWQANTQEQTIEPLDKRAKLIWELE